MEATENRNRTASRNDGAFNALTKKTQLGQIEIFYQFCNNPRCREVTMLLLPLNRTSTDIERKVFSELASSANLPALILEYPDQKSEDLTVFGFVGGKLIEMKMNWTKVRQLMLGRQIAHEEKSASPECANYTKSWLQKGNWSSAKENYRFSNEARAVPGVRHCDTDGIMYCQDCHVPVFVVEATSDGCPGTRFEDKHKATNMTKKVARILDAVPVLLQHHLHDNQHRHPVYLTTWDQNPQRQNKFTWDTAAGWFDEVTQELHTC